MLINPLVVFSFKRQRWSSPTSVIICWLWLCENQTNIFTLQLLLFTHFNNTLLEGPSTVFWVAVAACTVVIRPSRIPKLSLITYQQDENHMHWRFIDVFRSVYLVSYMVIGGMIWWISLGGKMFPSVPVAVPLKVNLSVPVVEQCVTMCQDPWHFGTDPDPWIRILDSWIPPDPAPDTSPDPATDPALFVSNF